LPERFVRIAEHKLRPLGHQWLLEPATGLYANDIDDLSGMRVRVHRQHQGHHELLVPERYVAVARHEWLRLCEWRN
jgi:hypothetical protein